MIDGLLQTLTASGLELTVEELADSLWLAGLLPEGTEEGAPEPSRPVETLPAREPPARWTSSRTETPPGRAAVARRPPEVRPAPVVLPEPRLLPTKTLPIRVPGGAALPHALEIGRALRPLHRRAPSRQAQVFDELASTELSAEMRACIPVMRPAMSRWLDVSVVVDAGASMALWKKTLVEFRDLLQFHGAFRNVWTWRLPTDGDEGELRLQAGLFEEESVLAESLPHELIDPRGTRVTLVVSDCVSRRWYTGEILRLLERWGRAGPVAVVQVLPEPLWCRTALSNGTAVALRAPRRCAPNSQLQVTRPTRRRRHTEDALVVPVLPLEAHALGRWAQLVAGSTVTVQGYALRPAKVLPPPVAGTAARELEAGERVRRFFLMASSPARKLATYLAAAPVCLPVMRLIRETLVPEADLGHIAEVFLGGLLRERAGQDASGDPDAKQYDFWPGVRELLLDSLPADSARKVLLGVSEFIEGRLGQTRDFPALLVDETKDPTPFVDQHRCFAEIAASVLQRMGGAYAELALRLSGQVRGKPSAPTPAVPLPGGKAAPRRARVELRLHAAYRGLEARVLDSAGLVVGSCVVDEHPWNLGLPLGSYVLEIPDVGVRRTLAVQEPSVFLSVDWALSGRRVLVTGSGTFRLTRAERWVAEAIGDLLARCGHTVLGGGWPGVDHMVARAYMERLREAGLSDRGSLLQLVPGSGEPYFKGGQVILVQDGLPVYDELLRRAEAVMLIGGTEGTFTVYQRARVWKRPLVPLVSTGGAAWQAFDQLWMASDEKVRKQLAVLHQPIVSQEDAGVVAIRAIGYLHTLLRAVEPVQATREPKHWASWLGTGEQEQRLRYRAAEYERIREHMRPGRTRLGVMNALVERVADEVSPSPSVRPECLTQAFEMAGLGGRVVLLGLLLACKEPYYFGVVREALSNSLSAFEQYTALRVADSMVEVLGREQRGELLKHLVMLLGANSLEIFSDPERMRLLKRLISRLERPEMGESKASSVSPRQEELLRAVNERFDEVKWGVYKALPQWLLGLEVKHRGLPSDNRAATIRGYRDFFGFHVDDTSIRRVGTGEVTLTARLFVCGALLEVHIIEAQAQALEEDEEVEFGPERNGQYLQARMERILEVAVQVRVELEQRGSEPIVFIQEVAGVQVVEASAPTVPLASYLDTSREAAKGKLE